MEVSPRDGLQNEDTLLTTEQKLQLIDHALDAGCKRIEVTSFVHPKRVPQMADAEAVCAGLPERADVRYTGLILNDRGYQRLRDTKLHEAGLVLRGLAAFAVDQINRHVKLILEPRRESGDRLHDMKNVWEYTVRTRLPSLAGAWARLEN